MSLAAVRLRDLSEVIGSGRSLSMRGTWGWNEKV